ncbi:MAG: hypothetical protein HKP57_03190 [Halobacteria archaeon]|nr:hypothetical protein [Halobacteria archaeon]
MDCYIVRIYRHIAGRNGQSDEIAGLVENVGERDSGKPFSTYSGLVEAIRDSYKIHATNDDMPEKSAASDLRMVRPVRGNYE